jgi:hypothetical protein
VATFVDRGVSRGKLWLVDDRVVVVPRIQLKVQGKHLQKLMARRRKTNQCHVTKTLITTKYIQQI